MKVIAILATLATLVSACSTNDPATTVSVVSGLESTTVATAKGMMVQGGVADVDEIKIVRMRVLVSRMLLHPSDRADGDSANDKVVKTSPFVFVADSSGTRVIAQTDVPAGTYNKIKFEIHRFSSSEVPMYISDTNFRDFVNDNRYTVIIEGALRRGTEWEAFTYRSKITKNIKLDVSPSLNVASGATTELALNIAPSTMFIDGSKLLDPSSEAVFSKIENTIKDAFRAKKR